MRVGIKSAALAAILALAACARPSTLPPSIDSEAMAAEAERQKEVVLRSAERDEMRLYDVAYPLLAGATDLCGGKTKANYGLLMMNGKGLDASTRRLVEATFELDSRPEIFHVLPGSPAAKAGLRGGDAVVTLGGLAMATGLEGQEQAGERLAELARGTRPIEITILRDGAERTVTLQPERICDCKLQVALDNEVNAFADGEAVHVNQGLIRFVENDTELAVVLAHELAHNFMRHSDAVQENRTVGGLLGLAVDVLVAAGGGNSQGAFTRMGADSGAQAYSVAFEQEADYVGLYIMAKAGLPIDGAPDIWRRMATINPQAIELAQSHPGTAERFLAMEKTVEEIKSKQAAGLPLDPATKPGS